MNDGNHYPDEKKQLILLKAHKRKSWRQEHYLLYEKDYRQNNCKRIISLDEFANDKFKALKDEKAEHKRRYRAESNSEVSGPEERA